MIEIKIKYTYNKIQNSPYATEVSRSRAESRTWQSLICTLMFFFSLLFCFVDSKDRWIAICGIIISILWFVYLITIHTRKTNELIEDAIALDIERQKPEEQRKTEQKKSVLVVGEDIPAGKYSFIATNPEGGMIHLFSTKGEALDRIYVNKKKEIKLKTGVVVKLFNCIPENI